VGDAVRRVSDLDRAALERDDYNFNIHLLLGGQRSTASIRRATRSARRRTRPISRSAKPSMAAPSSIAASSMTRRRWMSPRSTPCSPLMPPSARMSP
jgi:hypothetical protein